MADVNIEQEAKKVAELGMNGQGCAIWDELRNMDINTLKDILHNSQKYSPNQNIDQLRVLPGIQANGWGDLTEEAVDYVDANGNKTNIFSVNRKLFGNDVTCKNLSKL